MNFILQPWQLFCLILAGWMNRQQQNIIEYLRTENQVLREKLGNGRILLNDDQRRRLAVKGKILGRKRLEEVGTLFTPDDPALASPQRDRTDSAWQHPLSNAYKRAKKLLGLLHFRPSEGDLTISLRNVYKSRGGEI